MFDEPQDIFAGTNPPPNLPVGGGVPKTPAPASSTTPAPTTAPRPAPEAMSAPAPRPQSMAPVMPPTNPPMHDAVPLAAGGLSPASTKGSMVKTIIVIFVVLAIIAVAGVLSYLVLSRKSGEVVTVPEANTQETSPNQQTTPPKTNTQPSNQNNTQTLPIPTPETTPKIVDADSDGLSDAQEIEIGTNAKLADTDADGLSDREEVQVYKTDPLKADTDGDTYKDGDEIRNGYNPKGSGKLFEVPTP